MVFNNETYVYSQFSLGLNTTDDVFDLVQGQSPNASNQELVQGGGLYKKLGWEAIFAQLKPKFNIVEAYEYVDENDVSGAIAVSYPYLLSVKESGVYEIIYSDLFSDGKPFFWESSDQSLMMVDGKNNPIRIDNHSTVTEIDGAISYSHNNNDVNNVGDSVLGYRANPSGANLKNCNFGFYYKGRDWLGGDPNYGKTLYANTVVDKNEFNANNPTALDIAFFVDAPTPSKIVVGRVISDKFVILYCQRHLFVLSGDDPPGQMYNGEPFNIRPLNMKTGIAGKYLVVDRGNNDHYFLSRQGVVYQTISTENFQQVRPLGLTRDIYEELKALKPKTLARGKMANNISKGELWLILPRASKYRRRNLCYLLNYSDIEGRNSWSRIDNINDLDIRATIINQNDNSLILVTPDKFLQTDKGYSYDGYPIKLIHEMVPVDFGSSEHESNITWITAYIRSSTGGSFLFKYLWQDGRGDTERVNYDAFVDSRYGFDDDAANYGDDADASVYVSSAGEQFQKVDFYLKEPNGKILKARIEQESTTQELIIHKLVYNYTPFGKGVK